MPSNMRFQPRQPPSGGCTADEHVRLRKHIMVIHPKTWIRGLAEDRNRLLIVAFGIAVVF